MTNFFEQSPDEADPAVCHPVVVERMRAAKLARQPGIAVERPLDDVWKIAQVEKEHQWIFFRFCCAAIHVHDVADAHQSVVGDPQWHEDLQHRDRCSHPEKGGDVITDGTEEIEIFRSQEHEEHQEHRTEHDELFCRITAFFNAFRSSFASSFCVRQSRQPGVRSGDLRRTRFRMQQLKAMSGHRTTGRKIPAMQPEGHPTGLAWVRGNTRSPVTSRKQINVILV